QRRRTEPAGVVEVREGECLDLLGGDLRGQDEQVPRLRKSAVEGGQLVGHQPSGMRLKLRWERDAVGPRCPWYREPCAPEPYGCSAGLESWKKHSCPIFMPGHSVMGRVAVFDSSRVTWPVKPGSMKPAVECVSRPSRP